MSDNNQEELLFTLAIQTLLIWAMSIAGILVAMGVVGCFLTQVWVGFIINGMVLAFIAWRTAILQWRRDETYVTIAKMKDDENE